MEEAVKPRVFAWVLDVLEGLLGVALLRSLPSMSLLLLLFFFIAIHDALHFLRPQMSKQASAERSAGLPKIDCGKEIGRYTPTSRHLLLQMAKISIQSIGRSDITLRWMCLKICCKLTTTRNKNLIQAVNARYKTVVFT